MDQAVLVIGGAFVTVVYYIFSPIRLSERLLDLIERVGGSTAARPVIKTEERRRYYVHNLK